MLGKLPEVCLELILHTVLGDGLQSPMLSTLPVESKEVLQEDAKAADVHTRGNAPVQEYITVSSLAFCQLGPLSCVCTSWRRVCSRVRARLETRTRAHFWHDVRRLHADMCQQHNARAQLSKEVCAELDAELCDIVRGMCHTPDVGDSVEREDTESLLHRLRSLIARGASSTQLDRSNYFDTREPNYGALVEDVLKNATETSWSRGGVLRKVQALRLALHASKGFFHSGRYWGEPPLVTMVSAVGLTSYTAGKYDNVLAALILQHEVVALAARCHFFWYDTSFQNNVSHWAELGAVFTGAMKLGTRPSLHKTVVLADACHVQQYVIRWLCTVLTPHLSFLLPDPLFLGEVADSQDPVVRRHSLHVMHLLTHVVAQDLPVPHVRVGRPHDFVQHMASMSTRQRRYRPYLVLLYGERPSVFGPATGTLYVHDGPMNSHRRASWPLPSKTQRRRAASESHGKSKVCNNGVGGCVPKPVEHKGEHTHTTTAMSWLPPLPEPHHVFSDIRDLRLADVMLNAWLRGRHTRRMFMSIFFAHPSATWVLLHRHPWLPWSLTRKRELKLLRALLLTLQEPQRLSLSMAKDAEGQTLLHVACSSRGLSHGMVALLLQHGFSPLSTDARGRSPLECAQSVNNKRAIQALAAWKAVGQEEKG